MTDWLGVPPDPRTPSSYNLVGVGGQEAGLQVSKLHSLGYSHCDLELFFFLIDRLSFFYFSLAPVWLRRAMVKSPARCALRTDVYHCTGLGKKVRLTDTQIYFPAKSFFEFMKTPNFPAMFTLLCSIPSDSWSLFCSKEKVPDET